MHHIVVYHIMHDREKTNRITKYANFNKLICSLICKYEFYFLSKKNFLKTKKKEQKKTVSVFDRNCISVIKTMGRNNLGHKSSGGSVVA